MKKTGKHLIYYYEKFFLLFSLLSVIFFSCTDKKIHSEDVSNLDFEMDEFLNPPSEFKPFTRWWWPGNDVDEERLREEIRILAGMNFGGVEIQPFTTGINPVSKREEYVYSWDEASYYQNLETVMEEASINKIQIDLNGGSGWPMGGPFVGQEESILTLDIADTIVQGKGDFQLPIPRIKLDKSKKEEQRKRAYNTIYNELSHDDYELIAVICAKVKQYRGSQVILHDNVRSVNFKETEGMVSLQLDDVADYALIAIYIRPSAEKPLYIATRDESWVTDVLDKESIENSLEHLFGSGSGLEKYYGSPFRAVFFDSKEYITERHVSKDFIAYFKQKRGYDITPWLFTNAIEGYDNAYSFGRDTIPKFIIGDDDRRFRYDYNKTISELFSERTCNFTSEWLEKRGLLHRSQSYGMRADIISASGNTSVPEAEQLSGGGGDGFVKLISSGAHLYNKPVVSQEAFVFAGKTYMTTPQKIKVFSNKAFAAGVNQLVYHGTAYRYRREEYGEEGWYPWATPFRDFNYSSNINETNPFWEYIDDVNLYIAKMQYALRSGKPKVDVLIYFPFSDFEASQVIRNPNELVFNGSYTEDEPYFSTSLGRYVTNPTPIQNWFMETWELINLIESSGLTWDFVNDESLLESTSDRNGHVMIRNNEYQSLVIANLPYINLEVAKKIIDLADHNVKLLLHGELPDKQPGYLNYEQNEKKIKRIFDSLKHDEREYLFVDNFDEWFEKVEKPISFQEKYDFIKHQVRIMADGSMLKFLWNQTDEKKTITLELNKHALNHNYWICPEQNEMFCIQDSLATITMNPFEALLFYSSVDSVTLYGKSKNRSLPGDTIANLQQWTVKTANFPQTNGRLLQLKTIDEIAVTSDKIEYETSLHLNLHSKDYYIIDLGKVYYTAEVYINDTHVGQSIWSPYQLDISQYLTNGLNNIKIVVQPTKRNHYVKEALNGNMYYVPFKRKEPMMPAGLHGPVQIIRM